MKYVFNGNLLRSLSDVLGVTQKKICESYNGDEGTYVYRAMHGTIPMFDLISICDKFHIPISRFIVAEGKEMKDKDVLPDKSDIVYSGKWKNIENQWQYFGLSYSCYRGINHKDSAMECGIAMSNYYNLFINKEQRWKKSLVKDVLKILNNSHVYPGSLFVDKNEAIEVVDGYYGIKIRDKEINIIESHYIRKGISSMNVAEKQIIEMQEEIERLRGRVREMALELGNGVMRVAEDNDMG